MKYKNTILTLVALLLFAYAGFLTIYPAVLNNSFDAEKFGKKIEEASSLVTSVDSVNFKLAPSLELTITIANWSSKYIDNQDCFDAQAIILKTNPLAPITKNFKLKDTYLKNVKYSNQVLPDGNNKLAFLPLAFKAEVFGTERINITPSKVRINGFEMKDIGPDSYSEKKEKELTYDKQDVLNFISDYDFAKIKFNK